MEKSGKREKESKKGPSTRNTSIKTDVESSGGSKSRKGSQVTNKDVLRESERGNIGESVNSGKKVWHRQNSLGKETEVHSVVTLVGREKFERGKPQEKHREKK